MCKEKITFQSIDNIINILKEKYNKGGLKDVQQWVEATFQQNREMSIARDLNDLSNIENVTIYDRSIIKLDKLGEETNIYYLEALNPDLAKHNLFISIRLNFINEPFELLVFT